MKDKEILEPLADRLVELSEGENQEFRKRLWADFNALKPVERIPVCVTYEGIPSKQWELILGEKNFLHCSDDLARRIEFDLRRRIWVAENVPDDHPVFAAVLLSAVQKSPYDWGVKIQFRHPDDDLGSWEYVPPFKDEVDFSILKKAVTDIDEQATRNMVSKAEGLLGGKLAVRLVYPRIHESPFDTIVEMRGLERVMMDAVEHPEYIHGLMDFIVTAKLEDDRRREEHGWINAPSDPSGRYVIIPMWRHLCGYPFDDSDKRPPAIPDEWPYVSAQTSSGLSPRMYGEFVHKYSSHIAEQYTSCTCYYHGCENLDLKLKHISTLPNLRRHHVSPWSNVAMAADIYRGRVNLEVHSHPGKVFFGWNKEEMKAEVRRLVEDSGGHRMSINLSDIHSVNGDPRLLTAWAEGAQEIAEEFAG